MISVALPVYNNAKIVWLALEGLCNQKDIDFDWELLICEEQNSNKFGEDAFAVYGDRLREVGCVSMKYIPLRYHIPLPQKWRHMARFIDKRSEAFLLQASDDYPQPYRLKYSYEKIRDGYDWVHNRYGYFYNFTDKLMLRYDAKSMSIPTGLDMAVSTKLLSRLDESWQTSAVDRWFIKRCMPENIYWNEEDIIGGIYTDGFNTISTMRRGYYKRVLPPFQSTDKNLPSMLPNYIVKLMIYA